MSITETNVGISCKLHDIFGCFTRVSKEHKGSLRCLLVLREELESEPLYWEMMSNRYHLLQVTNLDKATEALEWYCMNYSFAVNSVEPGVPTKMLAAHREAHESSSSNKH
jgi:hypothetical protein